MPGEKDIEELLKTMKPVLNPGEFVFCTVSHLSDINAEEVVLFFRETEAITIIIKKELADSMELSYSFIAAWITLTVHSSLEAVGLTAAFSTALAKHHISCNVVAAYHHDHIFVDKKDGERAIRVLNALSN